MIGAVSSPYEDYVRSDRWSRSPARLEELRLSGHRCRFCGRGAADTRIEVHHRTYMTLGRERPADLCTLCSDCHSAVTEVLRRRRYAAAALPPLTDTVRVLPGRVVTEIAWSLPDA